MKKNPHCRQALKLETIPSSGFRQGNFLHEPRKLQSMSFEDTKSWAYVAFFSCVILKLTNFIARSPLFLFLNTLDPSSFHSTNSAPKKSIFSEVMFNLYLLSLIGSVMIFQCRLAAIDQTWLRMVYIRGEYLFQTVIVEMDKPLPLWSTFISPILRIRTSTAEGWSQLFLM